MITLNSRGRQLKSEKPLVMGIINCTDDSFYKASRSQQTDLTFRRIDEMVSLGADIIDVGGQSTKPGTLQVSLDVELERISPAISYLNSTYPDVWVSIDTTRSIVASHAVDLGAYIVNDISGGEMDPVMIPTVALLDVPFICMHMQGRPSTMQDNPLYDDVVGELVHFFTKKIIACKSAGIKEIIIDPGFGFGKTIEHNYTLVKHLHKLASLNTPLLVGFSRKSMIYKPLGTSPEDALNGTTVLNTIALLNGASILRVHDVKEAMEVVQLIKQLQRA
jgi:dihydropteroate synthase